jgi:hypothetical protein
MAVVLRGVAPRINEMAVESNGLKPPQWQFCPNGHAGRPQSNDTIRGMLTHTADVEAQAAVARREATPVRDDGSSAALSAAVETGRIDLVGPAEILRLQRAIGNAGVVQLLGEQPAQLIRALAPFDGAGTKAVAGKAEEGEDDGEPRKTEFAGKRSPELVMGVVQRQADGVVQRQAPPPGPDWVPPAGRASLNFLAILNDKVPTGSDWGVTHFDDPVIDITAYASGASWTCKITQADEQTHQGVRLLPGQAEVTPALVAGEASCPRLKTMRTSLDSVASQGPKSGFYMVAAVQSHEDVHVAQYRADLPAHYTTLKTAIEALTVPFAGTATAAAAKAAIKALPAYTTAMATFAAAEVAVNNKTGTHSPVAPFSTAEHRVVDPMITTIRARETALKCPA